MLILVDTNIVESIRGEVWAMPSTPAQGFLIFVKYVLLCVRYGHNDT